MVWTTGSEQKDSNHVPRGDLPTAQDNEYSVAGGPAANVVIFGTTGVGKSSVINLIANRELAYTSSDALGCTFQHIRYLVPLGTMWCAIWDTAGLDEAAQGTVPAKTAENHLRGLMRGLIHSGGIHLIIYCIRGRRLTQDLKRNYDLFYVTICRRKVPVALVVTGLEHQEGNMETWWTRNEARLIQNGMRFDAHACVTTLDVDNPIIQKRRIRSRVLLLELVNKFSGLQAWNTDLSLISRFFPSVIRGSSFTGSQGTTTIKRKVIVCDSFPELLPGTSASWTKCAARIGYREYEFLRVDRRNLHAIRTLEDPSVGTGVLVFYTSTLVDGSISSEDVDALKKFYDLAGGQLCPVILILRGCNDEQVARSCYLEVTSRHGDIRPNVISLPSIGDSQAELDEMIERLCIEHVEVKDYGLRKYIHKVMSFFIL